MPDNIKDFFQSSVQKKGYFKDESEFRNFISNQDNAKEFFNAEVSKQGWFKDFNEFNSFLGVQKKNGLPTDQADSASPSSSVDYDTQLKIAKENTANFDNNTVAYYDIVKGKYFKNPSGINDTNRVEYTDYKPGDIVRVDGFPKGINVDDIDPFDTHRPDNQRAAAIVQRMAELGRGSKKFDDERSKSEYNSLEQELRSLDKKNEGNPIYSKTGYKQLVNGAWVDVNHPADEFLADTLQTVTIVGQKNKVDKKTIDTSFEKEKDPEFKNALGYFNDDGNYAKELFYRKPELKQTFLELYKQKRGEVDTQEGRQRLLEGTIRKFYGLDNDIFLNGTLNTLDRNEYQDNLSKLNSSDYATKAPQLYQAIEELKKQIGDIEPKAKNSTDERVRGQYSSLIAEYNTKVKQITEIQKQAKPLLDYFNQPEAKAVNQRIKKQSEGSQLLSIFTRKTNDRIDNEKMAVDVIRKVLDTPSISPNYIVNKIRELPFFNGLAQGIDSGFTGIEIAGTQILNTLGIKTGKTMSNLDKTLTAVNKMYEPTFKGALPNWINKVGGIAAYMIPYIGQANFTAGAAGLSINQAKKEGVDDNVSLFGLGLVQAVVNKFAAKLLPEGGKAMEGFSPSRLQISKLLNPATYESAAKEIGQYANRHLLKQALKSTSESALHGVAGLKLMEFGSAITNSLMNKSYGTHLNDDIDLSLSGIAQDLLAMGVIGAATTAGGYLDKRKNYRPDTVKTFALSKAAEDFPFAMKYLDGLRRTEGVDIKAVDDIENAVVKMRGMKFPSFLTVDQKVAVANILDKIDTLNNQKKESSPDFHAPLDAQTKEYETKIQELIKDPEAAKTEVEYLMKPLMDDAIIKSQEENIQLQNEQAQKQKAETPVEQPVELAPDGLKVGDSVQIKTEGENIVGSRTITSVTPEGVTVEGSKKTYPLNEVELKTDLDHPHTTIDSLVGVEVGYEGKRGVIAEDGQSLVINMNDGKRVIELGNREEIGTMKPEEFGITHETSKVNITEKGHFEIDGAEYRNHHENPLDAIRRDSAGKTVMVVLTDLSGRTKKFRGHEADDLAYNITLQEINKDNETRDAADKFIESAAGEEIVSRENEGATEGETTVPNEPVSREQAKRREPGSTTGSTTGSAAGSTAKPTERDVIKSFTPEEKRVYLKHLASGNDEAASEMIKSKSSPQESTSNDQSVKASNKASLDALGEKHTDNATKLAVINAAKLAVKTLNSVLPGFDIHLHDSSDSYQSTVSQFGGRSDTRGNFTYERDANGKYTGRIDIDLNKADVKTIAHEVAHAVLLKSFGENPALFKVFRDRISKALGTEVNDVLTKFANEYDVKDSHEEYLAELTGILSKNASQIAPDRITKIAAIINDIVSKITGGKIKPFQDIKDTKDIIDFFNNVSDGIRRGEDLSNLKSDFSGKLFEPGNLNLEGRLDKPLPKTGRGPLSKADRGNYEMDQHPIIDKNTIVGKGYSVTMSDHTKVGRYENKKTNVSYDGLMGGVFYPYIKGVREAGLAWASVTVKAARALVENAVGKDITLVYRMARETGSRGNVNYNDIAFKELTAPVEKKLVTEVEFLKQFNAKLNSVRGGKQFVIGTKLFNKTGSETNETILLKKDGVQFEIPKKELKSLSDLKSFLDKQSFNFRGQFWSTILKDSYSKKSVGEWYKFLDKHGVASIEDINNGLAEHETDYAQDHDIVAAIKIAAPEYNEKGKVKIYTTRKNLVNEKNGIYFIDAPDHPSYPYVVKGEPIGVLDEFNHASEYFPIIEKWMKDKRMNSPYKAVETMVKELMEKTDSSNISLSNSGRSPRVNKAQKLSTNTEIVDGFYSPIEDRLNDFKQPKASAQKWKDIVGVKSDEAVYSGLADWLGGMKPDQQLSKDEVMNFMKNNRIEIKEVQKGGNEREVLKSEIKDAVYSNEWIDLGNGVRAKGDIGGFSLVDINGSRQRVPTIEAENLISKELKTQSRKTEYESYQLPGGDNYKEVLITLPNKTEGSYRIEKNDGIYTVVDVNGNDVSSYIYTEKEAQEFAQYLRSESKKMGVTLFSSDHFIEPNIITHLRMNTRTDADGKKVLFLEEVQSDWGQKGKKEGFKEELEKKNEEIIKKSGITYEEKGGVVYFYKDGKRLDYDDVPENVRNAIGKTVNEVTGIPAAPYVTNTNAWVKLGLKVALKEAVKQGADRIAWTTGEQQNERYSLSKQVDQIWYDKNRDGTYDITATKNREIKSQKYEIHENELEGLLGKDVAQKIVNGEGISPKQETRFYGNVLEGNDLIIGGKGMKAFYGDAQTNGIVGNVAKALVKELTGKEGELQDVTLGQRVYFSDNAVIEENRKGLWNIYDRSKSPLPIFKNVATQKEAESILSNPVKNASSQPGIEITPELAQAVQGGVSKFQKISPEEKLKQLLDDGTISKDEYDYGVDQINGKIPVTKEKVRELIKNNKPTFAQSVQQNKIIQNAKKVAHETAKAFHPFLLDKNGATDARDTAITIRKNTSREAFENTVSDEASKQVLNFWNKEKRADNVAFMLSLENPEEFGVTDPALKEFAGTYKTRLEDVFSAISKIKNVNHIEDYFPHFWKDPIKAKSTIPTLSNAPLEGSKSFLKKRFYASIMDGLDAGLELATYNPEEMVRLAERNALHFTTANQIFTELKDQGLIRYFESNPGENWVKVTDPLFTKGAKDKLGASGYYAVESAGTVLNNFTSRGLFNQPGAVGTITKSIRHYNNIKNQVQLGVGFFHFTTTTVDATVSGFANGLKELTSLNPSLMARGVMDLVTSATVLPNLAQTFARGFKANKDYKLGRVTQDVQSLIDGGARTGKQIMYSIDAAYQMKKGWNNFKADGEFKDLGKAVWNGLWVIPEKIVGHALMDVWVPALKTGGYLRALDTAMATTPDISPKELDKVKARIQDSMDNRLGQVVYDNLFWNKSMKDLGFMSIRSLGWTGGTLKAFGTGVGDVFKKNTSGSKGLPLNTAWAVSLPILVGMYGALYQYMMTGKKPESFEDYYFPKDGSKNPDGTDHRVSIPSYMKDVYSYVKNGPSTLTHKISPFYSELNEMLNNKDFYGVKIVNPDDSWYQKGIDLLRYQGKSMIPFTFRQRTGEEEGFLKHTMSKEGIEQLMGIMPAPREMERNDLENMIAREGAKNYSTEAKTKEQADAFAARHELRILVGSGVDVDKIPEDLFKRTKMSDDKINELIEDSKEPYYAISFKHLKPEQQLKVWGSMNEKEKNLYYDYLHSYESFDKLLEDEDVLNLHPEYKKILDDIDRIGEKK